MLETLMTPEVIISFLTLAVLEIVLGIDNIIFLTIISEKLPKAQQPMVRRIGLLLALGMRIVLLSMILWIAHLTTPIFTVWDHSVSWRDVIMLVGGAFLLFKGTMEIHHHIEGSVEERTSTAKASAGFAAVIAQIVVIDLVFSLDSVITAVGMTDNMPVMVAAVVAAIAVMMLAAEPVSAFVQTHPTVKMLALSFLLLIGMTLIADGLHFHIPKGYLYFAVAFSLGVEALNLWARGRKNKKTVH